MYVGSDPRTGTGGRPQAHDVLFGGQNQFGARRVRRAYYLVDLTIGKMMVVSERPAADELPAGMFEITVETLGPRDAGKSECRTIGYGTCQPARKRERTADLKVGITYVGVQQQCVCR